ncbi:hypothetical protein BDR26DRAFT_1003462 [Obelidium mucronatum]|nr:hypothetical protein BDR26DRAFT_1003462 [Obelidium mucronatum]
MTSANSPAPAGGSSRTKKRFHCGVEGCGGSFSTSGHLARHQRIHIGARPFACNLCPRTFYRHDNLTQHRKSHREYDSDSASSGAAAIAPFVVAVESGLSNLQVEANSSSYTSGWSIHHPSSTELSSDIYPLEMMSKMAYRQQNQQEQEGYHAFCLSSEYQKVESQKPPIFNQGQLHLSPIKQVSKTSLAFLID